MNWQTNIRTYAPALSRIQLNLAKNKEWHLNKDQSIARYFVLSFRQKYSIPDEVYNWNNVLFVSSLKIVKNKNKIRNQLSFWVTWVRENPLLELQEGFGFTSKFL